MNASFWRIAGAPVLLFVIGTAFTSCDKPCSKPYSYKAGSYRIRLEDSSRVFKSILYSPAAAIETPLTNDVLWKFSISTPLTTMLFETSTGWDTLTYSIDRKTAYRKNQCDEVIVIGLSNARIVSHTFDTAYIRYPVWDWESSYSPESDTSQTIYLILR